MQRIEIRFDTRKQLDKGRIRNAVVEICEKVLEAGAEGACLQSGDAPYVIVCNVLDASRAWSAIQDCLEERGLINYATVYTRLEEGEDLTQIYPVTRGEHV